MTSPKFKKTKNKNLSRILSEINVKKLCGGITSHTIRISNDSNTRSCSSVYTSNRFHKVIQFVQKNSNICVMKEKQTPAGLRLLLTFENAKTTRRCLELIELLGQE